jgi:hypothetical protein
MDKEVKPITRQAWKRLMEKGYATPATPAKPECERG